MEGFVMSKSFYVGTDHEVYTGSQSFAMKIVATPAAYGLTEAMALAYNGLNSQYAQAYLAALDPEQRTKGKISAKNAAKRDLKVMASDLAKIINGTPSVTDEQKIDLGLAVRKKPTAKQVPTEAPMVEVESRIGTNVKLRVHAGDSNRRGRPANAAGVAIFSYVGATPPVDIHAWRTEGISGKTIIDIDFDPSLPAGTQVWFTAFWYNAHGNGPGTSPVGTVLAGGAMQMAA
jgi:hypothetical protein